MFGADTLYLLKPMDSKALKQLLELEHTMLDIKAGCLPANYNSSWCQHMLPGGAVRQVTV